MKSESNVQKNGNKKIKKHIIKPETNTKNNQLFMQIILKI